MIEKKSVTKQVVNYLKENIENGVWKPGDKIPSENMLTEILGVSRPSVRFAIQQLVAVGTLESFHGKGTYVARRALGEVQRRLQLLCEDTQIEQLMEFRRMIESESCYLAAARRTSFQLEKLHRYLEAMKAEKNNAENFIKNDMAFHRVVLEATGNKLVVQSILVVMGQIEMQQRALHTEFSVQRALYFHEVIYKALLEKNGKAARVAMNRHLSWGVRNFGD